MPETTYSYSASIDSTHFLVGVIEANGVLNNAGVTIVSWASMQPNQIDLTLSDELSSTDKATLDTVIGSYMHAVKYSLTDFSNGFNLQQFREQIEAEETINANVLFMDIVSSVIGINFDAELSSEEQTALDNIVNSFVERSDSSVSTNGYVVFESSLADAAAIKIQASDTVGGIDIDAGSGGITVDTTNAISLDAAAASNFTTSTGNLTLNASTGLVNIDGGSGVNIGSQAESQPINIGTGAAARTISIGNTTGATAVNIDTGSGGFSIDASGGGSNVGLATTGDAQDLTIGLTGANDSSIIISSEGTGADAILVYAAGGVDIDCGGTFDVATSNSTSSAIKLNAVSGAGGMDIDLGTSGLDLDTSGEINLATSKAAGGAVTLEASSGGITISGGTFGTAINSGTGLIGIGHWSAGNIDIGTSATARTITIGNATGASSLDLNAGSGGITLDTTTGGGISINASGASSNFSLETIGAGQDLTIGLTGATDSSLVLSTTGTGSDALRLYAPSGGIDIDSGSTIDISGGAISIDGYGAASNLALATNGDAQDLTIAVYGATDSSLVLTSSGTGADAILMYSAAGIDIDCVGAFNVASSSSAADAIRLSASSGGMDIDIGNEGLDLDASGSINFATSSTSSAAIALEANSGGINIAGGGQGIGINTSGWLVLNGSSSGPVYIGTSASAKTVTVGSTTGASGLALRHGTNGFTTHQPTHTSLGSGNQTLTIAQLLTRVLSGSAGLLATLTLPTAALSVAGISGITVDDSIDFTIINGSGLFTYTLGMGTGGTAVGNMTTAVNSSALFRMRFTNITASSEAYTVYRIA